MPRRVLVLALMVLALVLPLPACGGGGGGGSGGGGATPTLPGALVALAVQGAAAPGTTVGTVGLIPQNPIMDTANGGWVAFMLPVTTPGGTVEVLYVSQPDGVIVEVWAQGDNLPGGASTIADFRRVWIAPTGTVWAAVNDSNGDEPVFITARVSGGVATPLARVVEPNDTLPGSANTWFSFVLESVCLTDTGVMHILGRDNTFADHLASFAADGGTRTILVSEGAALPGAVTLTDLLAYGVSSDGTRFAFAADVDAGEERLYSGTPGSLLFLERLQEGDALPLPFGGTVRSVWQRGPILVYANNTIIVQGEGDTAVTDDILLSLVVDGGGSPLPAVLLLRSGAQPPGLGSALVSDILLLNQLKSSSFPMFRVTVVGHPTISVIFYALASDFEVVLFNTQGAPNGDRFSSSFPCLAQDFFRDASRDGSLAFRNVLDSGVTGMFWVFRDDGLFAVALEGDAIPGGGDTFASFGIGCHSVANDVLAFRATLIGAGSALFKQGP